MTSPEIPSTGNSTKDQPRTFHLKTMLLISQLPSLADKSCAIGASLGEHYVKIFNAPESQGSQTQHPRKFHPHPQGGGGWHKARGGGGVHASQKPLKRVFDPPTPG